MTLSVKNTLLIAFALCLDPVSSYGQQLFKKFDFHGTIGLANGSLNFHQSIASGFSMGFVVDLLAGKNSSLSIGTNIKYGMENKDGLGYVAILADLISSGSVSTNNSNTVTDFGEFPLSLYYNYGYGSSSKSDKKVGFFIGGGMSYLLTGYAYGNNDATHASFWGWNAEAGIRFNNLEISAYKIYSIGGPIPGIYQPQFYGLNISVFIGSQK